METGLRTTATPTGGSLTARPTPTTRGAGRLTGWSASPTVRIALAVVVLSAIMLVRVVLAPSVGPSSAEVAATQRLAAIAEAHADARDARVAEAATARLDGQAEAQRRARANDASTARLTSSAVAQGARITEPTG